MQHRAGAMIVISTADTLPTISGGFMAESKCKNERPGESREVAMKTFFNLLVPT